MTVNFDFMSEKKTYIVHLYFKNSMHVGSSRSGVGIEATQDFIHSDTLWAAIANYWSLLGTVAGISFDDFLDGFREKSEEKNDSKQEPLFRLSSAFPFTPQDSKRNYWLPKPLSVPFSLSVDNDEQSKKKEHRDYGKNIKEARFITRESFMRWQAFNSALGADISSVRQNGISQGEIRAQVAIDRTTSRYNLYHSGITYFKPHSERVGLYWLLQAEDCVKNALHEVLQVIRDIGAIGGNVSSGCGELNEFNIQEIDAGNEAWSFIWGAATSNAYCLLSLYYPFNHTEYKGGLVAFNNVIRKGWTGSLTDSLQKKRKTVVMLSEGSVLTEKVLGGIADVTPDESNTSEWKGHHNVFRYGYAFLVPIKVNFEDK